VSTTRHRLRSASSAGRSRLRDLGARLLTGLRAWVAHLRTVERTRRHLVLGGLLVLALAVANLGVVTPTPLSGGPRPPLTDDPRPDIWVPPRPHTDERFATFPVTGPQGETGLWTMPSVRVPIDFVVEQEVVDRYGLDELSEAVESFNDVPGSRFGASLGRIVDDGVEERARDGVNRIFFDRRSCGERYLARAHLWSLPLHIEQGRATRYVAEVDIGLCDRLDERWLQSVVRHELAHIAGLDHLCNPGEDCHRPGMGEGDHTCRMMYTRLHECQEVTQGDFDGLVHLHPRLPRAGGGDDRSSTAAAARAAYPTARANLDAVLAPHDAPLVQRLVSATLAGHLGAPHVLVDEACTAGPDGAALNHVLALAGRVTAVGELPQACAVTLQASWELEIETLTDARAVVDRIAEETDRPPTRLVLAPRPDESRQVPIAATAAAGAVALGAPLMVLGPQGELAGVLDVLEAHDSIREVVVAGDLRHVGTPVLSALVEHGVAVRRLSAADATEVTARLLEQPELAWRGPWAAAVVSAGHAEHATAGVSLAGALGGLLLPVDDDPDEHQLALLDEAFDDGAIVGGVQAISPELQLRLSRALDGDR
jgi:hypothetical protein